MKLGKKLSIKALPYDLSVCKVESFDATLLRDELCFVGKTDEELSLVCQSEHTPENCLAREDGWKAFRVQGVLDFSLTGILAGIAKLLSENGVPIFAVSTYNTDYILIKTEKYQKALDLLVANGYSME